MPASLPYWVLPRLVTTRSRGKSSRKSKHFLCRTATALTSAFSKTAVSFPLTTLSTERAHHHFMFWKFLSIVELLLLKKGTKFFCEHSQGCHNGSLEVMMTIPLCPHLHCLGSLASTTTCKYPDCMTIDQTHQLSHLQTVKYNKFWLFCTHNLSPPNWLLLHKQGHA